MSLSVCLHRARKMTSADPGKRACIRSSTSSMAETSASALGIATIFALTATAISSPSWKVIRLTMRSTSGWAATNSVMAMRISGDADSPVMRLLTSMVTANETPISNSPTAIEPRASKIGFPVRAVNSSATKARLRPARAAMSSPAITSSSDCRVSRNQRHRLLSPRSGARACKAPRRLKVSRTMATSSTPREGSRYFTGSGCSSARLPCQTENRPPMLKRRTPTIMDQK